jgi:hypothetical protein
VDCGDCSTHGHIVVKKRLNRENPDNKPNAWGAQMTTIQAVFFGVMLALTPSLVLLAFLLWREGIGLRSNSEFDRQPPIPRPNSQIQPAIEIMMAARKSV